MDYERLLALALDLPPEQRGDLAARLIESLDPPADDTIEDVEAAWTEEIKRRIASIDEETAVLVSGEQALAQIREGVLGRGGIGES